MTATLGTIYVIFKKVITLISVIMLLVVSGDEKNIPAPEGAEVIGKTTYVLYDYQITSQGVTNDGEYFYFSGNKNLGKADLETGEIFRITVNAIPDELEEMGYDHIGGLSIYNGLIYAAVEDGPDYERSCIVLYDAETLKYTGRYYPLPYDLHKEGVPWCAVDAEKNYFYTAEWTNAAVLNVFDLETFELVKTVPLSQKIDRCQGAEMFGGRLYMSCDELDGNKHIYSVDVVTGDVQTVFTRNVGESIEAEGMTVYADENGEPVFCVLDRGERRVSSSLTRYMLAD
ncbi:MAG: hypothetical protein IIU80_04265 [Clostridia bacterium]|nr:hypothetical protein [Clostridia bacterium]